MDTNIQSKVVDNVATTANETVAKPKQDNTEDIFKMLNSTMEKQAAALEKVASEVSSLKKEPVVKEPVVQDESTKPLAVEKMVNTSQPAVDNSTKEGFRRNLNTILQNYKNGAYA